MPNLTDSCSVGVGRISVRALARDAGLSFPLSLRSFIKDAECPFDNCNHLHLKVLAGPDIPIGTMLRSIRDVYATTGIGVRVLSREELTGPAFATLLDVDVDAACQTTTAEQNHLFQNRNNVGNDEIVAYFVRSTNPAMNGCASFPAGQPGAVIAKIASRWTLAHEIGHVLGLNHLAGEKCQTNPDFTRLMTGCGTSNITATPGLVKDEINTMNKTDLTRQC